MRRFSTAATALLLLLAPALLSAQGSPAPARSPDEQAALDVVLQLFNAMKTRDTATMRTLMDPNARLTSSAVRQGQPMLQADAINDWINGVARAPDSLLLEERTWNHDVKVDDGLAVVWAPYAFYINNRFSHCGVDAFTLIKTAAGWKVVAVSDTRRRDRCNEPAR